MKNYSMQKGIARNRKIRAVKRFVLALMVLFTILAIGQKLVEYWGKQDTKIMSTEYCWDESGNHYIAPDENCW